MHNRIIFPLAMILAGSVFACSSSSDVTDEGDGDTGTTTDTAVGDVRADSPGGDTSKDALGTDTATSDTATGDGTATDTAATDTAGTDSAGTDTAKTDTATGDTTPGPCTVDAVSGKSTGCSATEYCDAPSCTSGTCKPRPAATTDFAPACGCDGVTYWSSTYGKSLGTSMPSGVGACGTGKKTCGGIASIKCPSTDDTCVADHSGVVTTCGGADLGGTCWAIPSGASCSGVVGFTSYRVCGGSGPACKTYCDAVKSGRDFFSDATCPT
jgi:hypothetical protein